LTDYQGETPFSLTDHQGESIFYHWSSEWVTLQQMFPPKKVSLIMVPWWLHTSYHWPLFFSAKKYHSVQTCHHVILDLLFSVQKMRSCGYKTWLFKNILKIENNL
jgi:hypothetical protein